MRTPTPWLLPTQPVTTSLLLAAGVTRTMIDTRVRCGDLLRIRQGVYLAAAAWPDDAARQHVLRAHAEATANPSAVLSHQSAAVVWGLPSPRGPWHDQPVSVTLPAGGGTFGESVRGVHHVADLPPDQVTRDPDGFAITSLARTAIDLAAGLDLPDALVLLDGTARKLCEGMVASIRRTDYSNPRLVAAARELLTDVATSRRRPSLLEPIALCEPSRESAAESMSAGHFELAGLPRPEYQVPVRTPFGTFFPDCYGREQDLIGECDGAGKYANARAYVNEKQREQVFRDLEHRMVRWLAEEIMFRPGVVVARVARSLGL
ncbi:MAG: type IV toxin-antitoxin system AbiEi family antitoxin domain-containing protein [Actinobacteria bacterium]|nr:type IV toxin-antitoxin system AbiEi family antitoxin domain-containing protein [Actinomycetota bacterium]